MLRFVGSCTLLFLLVCRAAKAAPEPWSSYTSERHGFGLSYPSELVAGKGAEGGSSCEFHTPDGAFSVNVEASSFIAGDESLDTRWRSELTVLGSSATYKTKAATWYVTSGVDAEGAEYYHKFYSRGRNWVTFWIHYPHSQAAKFDVWVTRIEKNFVPFGRGKIGAVAPKPREPNGAAEPVTSESTAPPGNAPPSQPTPEQPRVEPEFIAPPPLGASIINGPPPAVAPTATPSVTPPHRPRQASGRWHLTQPDLRNYPSMAKYGRLEGSGVVKVSTDGAGQITSVEIVQSANPLLDAAVKEHARSHWRGPPNSSRTVPFSYRNEQ